MAIEVYHNMLPVCTLTKEEHGIELDYDKIINFVEKIEPEVLKLEVDKGHYNEQITWLVEGDMKFNINGETKNLSTCDGVNIGEFQKHGGFSTGAVGFDVFYPKRLEKRYLN